jgi:Spy/CpxP family protein refolding chaperone
MSRRILLTVVLGALMLPAMAMAQTDSRPADSNRGDRSGGQDRQRGRGGFDPARMREWMLGQIKEQLSPSDDEWKVLQPKLEKVIDARREAGSFGGGFRDRGSDSSSTESRSAVDQARHDLRQVLDNKSAAADEIAKKLTALREARDKAKTTLASAQKDLKEVLTQRQEATLVMYGMLD